jgi:hypothetical protein
MRGRAHVHPGSRGSSRAVLPEAPRGRLATNAVRARRPTWLRRLTPLSTRGRPTAPGEPSSSGSAPRHLPHSPSLTDLGIPEQASPCQPAHRVIRLDLLPQRRLGIWCRKAGVDRRISPHDLRHSFAIRLYRKTRDLLLVQAALRHRSIASTCVYAHTDDRAVRVALS